jgi:hypothetical protein
LSTLKALNNADGFFSAIGEGLLGIADPVNLTKEPVGYLHCPRATTKSCMTPWQEHCHLEDWIKHTVRFWVRDAFST